jgi:HD-GYP domain-containing protein (c-di-GMP phosphodiesterase class II)
MSDFARETAAVIRALRERDESTSAHCGRTCALSVETGKACGLSSSDLATLKLGAELHNIGKIGKAGSLTARRAARNRLNLPRRQSLAVRCPALGK